MNASTYNARSQKSFYFKNLLLAGVLNAWKYCKCGKYLYFTNLLHGC